MSQTNYPKKPRVYKDKKNDLVDGIAITALIVIAVTGIIFYLTNMP